MALVHPKVATVGYCPSKSAGRVQGAQEGKPECIVLQAVDFRLKKAATKAKMECDSITS